MKSFVVSPLPLVCTVLWCSVVVSNAGVLFEVDFERGATPTAAHDPADVTLTGGPQFVDGVKGKAIVLRMNRDRLSYPCAGNMDADEGSLSLWVKPLTYDCTEQRGFKVLWQVGYLDWCLYHYQQNYMLFLVGGGSSPPGVNFYARPTKGAWSHYVVTWDRRTSVARVFHNGRRVASKEGLPPPSGLPKSFSIGNATDWATPDGPFDTTFDECRIYDRALNDAEAAALYASYLPPVETGPPMWTVPRIRTAPEIDGAVEEREWQGAACISGFISHQGGRSFARRQTRCWLAWDDACFYAAFRSPHKAKDDVLITIRGRDANAYEDESYEMFLWPAPEQLTHYYQIIGSLGALYDSKGAQTDVDLAGLRYRNSQHDGVFDAEFAIPFADMGVRPRNGMAWKAMLARNFVEGGREFTTWARIRGGYCEPESAGTLLFSDTAPAIRMLGWGDLTFGQAAPRLELVNHTRNGRQLACDLWLGEQLGSPDPDVRERAAVTVAPGATQVVEPEWPAVRGNHRVAALRVTEAGPGKAALVDFALPFVFTPAIEGRLVSQPSRNRLRVDIDARAVAATGVDLTGVASLSDADGNAVVERDWLPGEDGRAVIVFSTEALPLGAYEVSAGLRDAGANPVAAWRATWDKLDARPGWLAEPVGLQRSVPKPFTPVEVLESGSGPSRVRLGVWGRTVAFDRSLLPVGIESQGRQLLRGPIRLNGELAGAEWQDPLVLCRPVQASPDQVTMQVQGRAPCVAVDASWRLEFDGMLLVTMSVGPWPRSSTEHLLPRPQLKSLTLDLPLRREAATLLHHNGCSASGGGWAGECPETWQSGLRPIVWLGNEDVGLCFFAENRNGWRTKQADRMLEILTTPDARILRLNLVDHPVALTEPLEITFGLIATPLRPMPENWLCWSWRTVTHFMPQRDVSFVPGPHETVLSIPWWDESQQFLHEKQGDWETWAKEKAWHREHGRRFLKYTQTLGLGDTPERRFWGHEWEMAPRDGRSYCPASDFRHLVAAGIGDRIVKGGVDGIYFDVAYPKPCANADHGCDGSFTILAQRDIRRRVANLFEQSGRPGMIFEHMSMNMYGPAMSFATVYLDGEQYYGRIHDDYRAAWTLGYLRAMNIGTNWGLVPQFLPMVTTKDEEAAKRASDSLVAMWTLHAPLRHCIAWRAGPAYTPAFELDQAFDFTPDTKRLGYWENADWVDVSPADVKVTLYRKPGRILLVASNLTYEGVEASIRLTTPPLGPPPASLKLDRVLGNQPVPPTLAQRVLRGPIRAGSCLMCIVEVRSP